MILHPIACGIAFIAFLLSLGAGVIGSVLGALVAFIAWVLTLVVMAVDFTLFGVRHTIITRITMPLLTLISRSSKNTSTLMVRALTLTIPLACGLSLPRWSCYSLACSLYCSPVSVRGRPRRTLRTNQMLIPTTITTRPLTQELPERSALAFSRSPTVKEIGVLTA